MSTQTGEVRKYINRSHDLLVKARQELADGDLEQASEKAWGAAALMVKAAAETRQIPHVTHRGLWDVVGELVDETEDDELSDIFGFAGSLHKNFYENRMRARTVRRGIDRMEQFVEKMESLI